MALQYEAIVGCQWTKANKKAKAGTGTSTKAAACTSTKAGTSKPGTSTSKPGTPPPKGPPAPTSKPADGDQPADSEPAASEADSSSNADAQMQMPATQPDATGEQAEFEWQRHFASMGTPGNNPSSPSVASDRSTYLDATDSTAKIAMAIDKIATAKAQAAESKALLYKAKQTKAAAALIEAESRAEAAKAQADLQREMMQNSAKQTDAVLALLNAVMNRQ